MPPLKDSECFAKQKPSIPRDQLDAVKKQTRILSYEKEVVGFAFTQIDDAETSGRIGERARTQLLAKYSSELTQLERKLSQNHQIIRLDELEKTKNDLTYLFNEKMGHISLEIVNIKSLLHIVSLEPERQVLTDQELLAPISTRHWGSMKNIFVVFAVILLLITSSSYTFGFLFNQQYFTQDFVNPQEPIQNISDQRITSSTGITASVNLGVFFDNESSIEVTNIDWGIVYPEDQIQYVVYLQNLGNVYCQLHLNTTDWTPHEAQDLISFTWNYDGGAIEPGAIIQVTFSLHTSDQLDGIKAFSFNIVITSTSIE